jgi:hypothetical protein
MPTAIWNKTKVKDEDEFSLHEMIANPVNNINPQLIGSLILP